MDTEPAFQRIALLGLGLMGGSFALAARRAGLAVELVGYDADKETLAEAVVTGIIEQGASDACDAADGVDLVVLAAPVRAILTLLDEVAPVLRPGTLVLDLGSTKQAIVAAMDRLPVAVRAVGGHPMAGKEVAGLKNAEAELFIDATFAFCATARTDQMARTQVEQLAVALGARPLWLDPVEHDALVATVSHLPYLLSVALVRAALAADNPHAWTLAASGFRDTSRLAASDERMILDILRTNVTALRRALASAREELDALDAALAADDESLLRSLLRPAAEQRRRLFPRPTPNGTGR
ncbi:MAG: prephenate dehydrogenase/arogenate dehydrogenase family protein [Ardenticatenaceae bacterium]|nr:prephenate dehydrogenase/arogenate dehydrogenase family protein [Ardenticatenaceae bacterium]HBY95430.1 prephenate dehydrogenase/arogenate dehydrogenase family protein [Chloroflexota bacterium]